MTQTHRSRHRFHTALASGVVAALLGALAVPAAAQNVDPVTPAPFGFSTFAAEGRRSPASATPISGAALLPSATIGTASVSVGSNVNIIGSSDVTQQATIDGTTVKTCDPGKQTAQNETSIAVDPGNANSLVAGANDYRLYEPTEGRYDGSG
ncbi:MAG: hypothetical protein KGQ88_05180, partial [Chloroflexi bacterium]|nr:hypothetical protein [Chloroflexota bacterium]